MILGVSAAAIAMALLSAGPAQAVNCKFVLKNLSIGRTPEQVAETMMISVEEIEKCQAEAAEQKAAEGAGGEGGEQKEAAPSN